MKLTEANRNTLKQHFRNLVARGHLQQQVSGRGFGMGWGEVGFSLSYKWPMHIISHQQLKDEVRLERAKDLLLRTSKPINQVAASGFRNEKGFMRAFRESSEQSPAVFRESA